MADDQPIVHAGISYMLAGIAWLQVVGGAHTARETVALARETSPDVALLGLRLPVTLTDEVISQLREDVPGIRIVLFAPRPLDGSALAAPVDGMLCRRT